MIRASKKSPPRCHRNRSIRLEPARSVGALHRSATRREAIAPVTFFATGRKLSGRNGKTVCVFGLPRTKTTTRKNKRKSNYEKSIHSVQTNSSVSDPPARRLLCGSVYLGTHSRVRPQPGAIQWHCHGAQLVAVLYGLLRSYRSRVQFRRRESVGSLYRHRGIFPASLRTRPESLCK